MPYLMHQSMRWFGPNDPVSLTDIRQAGATGVVTALHHVPVGEIWTTDEINRRKDMIAAAGLVWNVVESVNIHESIKTHVGDFDAYIDKYAQTLRNLAACDVRVVTYNFMPALDWIRTDLDYVLEDGAQTLRFEKDALAAFDLFMLKREAAFTEHTAEQIARAEQKLAAMTEAEKAALQKTMLAGLPGSDDTYTMQELRTALQKYAGMDRKKLKEHLFYFLRRVAPVAEEVGVKLAVHPDDPPYSLLGLPRVVSTEQDLEELLAAAPTAANGLCFCTGSLGVRPENDLPKMIHRFSDRIHFVHLRSTQRDAQGNFHEARHLEGNVDMYSVVKELLAIMQRRQFHLPMRPDHGHLMLDDLKKKVYPGYSAIGRLKGLAELRGLEMGISRSLKD